MVKFDQLPYDLWRAGVLTHAEYCRLTRRYSSRKLGMEELLRQLQKPFDGNRKNKRNFSAFLSILQKKPEHERLIADIHEKMRKPEFESKLYIFFIGVL